jgi:hypothetical protein
MFGDISFRAANRPARSRHNSRRVGRLQGTQQDIHCAPRQLPMLVTFPTECSCPVGFLAGGTDRRLFIEISFDTKWLPRDHTQYHRLVNITAMLIRTRVVKGHANVRCSPGGCRVLISYSTHVPCLEILLARLADGQSGIWKLDIQRLLEPRRGKVQYVLRIFRIGF